ncbi:hypothetical protein SKAU_G00125220 [Synaphobranchus kaupii]|uniref:Uncharacterized protein n=1 Tax=Synaphobranchus kaupii TaxID=118154 RepID=A0A9Q1FPV7_SYNKA|nr:hypothetical protein SKAU_G00125220 [Synaphobranchus kaupii]
MCALRSAAFKCVKCEAAQAGCNGVTKKILPISPTGHRSVHARQSAFGRIARAPVAPGSATPTLSDLRARLAKAALTAGEVSGEGTRGHPYLEQRTTGEYPPSLSRGPGSSTRYRATAPPVG